MKLGRVIGRVVCTQKMECFEGLKLLLVQPVDEGGKDAGSPLVAFDVARAGEGDLVMFPKGLKCRWIVHERIEKVYLFE